MSQIKFLTFTRVLFCMGIISNAHAEIISDMPYQLMAIHSFKCLDIRAPKTLAGSITVQMGCSNEAFQQWKIRALGNKEYQIISAVTNMCLDVNGSSKADGAVVKQSPCIQNKANQTWYFETLDEKTYKIISKNSGKCLDVTGRSMLNDIPIQQWECKNEKNQIWEAKETIKPSPPIVIDGKKDITISNVQISNLKGPCILIKNNSSNITVKNSILGPCKTDTMNPKPDLTNVGAGVFTINSTGITVDNNRIRDTDDSGVTIFYGSNFNVRNNEIKNALGHAIKAQGLSNITIENNKILTARSGIYASKSSNVKVLKNYIEHIQGTPRGNSVQFNQVVGTGNRIMCNTGLQDPVGKIGSKDSIEDSISVYLSKGTLTDPILVVGNNLKNGGPSKSGSGIMLGDSGGENIIARDNVIVNSGNLGIAISGGINISILNNKIFSKSYPITNNALAVWNWRRDTVKCDRVTASDNAVNWVNQWGPDKQVWTDYSCSNQRFERNKFMDASLTESIFDTYRSSECR